MSDIAQMYQDTICCLNLVANLGEFNIQIEEQKDCDRIQILSELIKSGAELENLKIERVSREATLDAEVTSAIKNLSEALSTNNTLAILALG